MDIYIAAARMGITNTGVPSKEYMDNLPNAVEQISRLSWTNLDAGQNQLAEPAYTVGFLGVLAAKTKCPEFQANLDEFRNQLSNYIPSVPSTQLQYVPSLIVDISDNLKTALLRRKTPWQGISLLTQIARQYQARPTQLTSVHTNVLELCLAAQNPKAGLPLISEDIDDFSGEIRGQDCKSLILYYYYAGMICTALKDYDAATYHFEAAIHCPASTLSLIMLEAYKKLILVSLIHQGEMPFLHKSVNPVVTRILKPEATPYSDLATSFLTFNPVDLSQVISRNRDVYGRDENFGLVKQVQTAQTKLSILRLTKTFLTLSLADVAARVQLQGPEQAESYILSMIEDGQIFAKITQKDGMVVFLDNKEKYNGADMMQKIEKQIDLCVSLNKKLEAMNDSIATNPDFITKVVSSGGEDEGISSSKSMFGPV